MFLQVGSTFSCCVFEGDLPSEMSLTILLQEFGQAVLPQTSLLEISYAAASFLAPRPSLALVGAIFAARKTFKSNSAQDSRLDMTGHLATGALLIQSSHDETILMQCATAVIQEEVQSCSIPGGAFASIIAICTSTIESSLILK